MQKKYISLLYPCLNQENEQKNANISSETLKELELSSVIDLKNSRLCDYFSTEKEVIEYRQGVFKDMLENEELCTLLIKVSPILNDISELRRLSAEAELSDSYLYSITEIELYVTCMELLSKGLKPLRDSLHSQAFIDLYDSVMELTESEYYIDLNNRLKELTSRVREVKSVTIGVNLDARLRPESAGVLSVNNEVFKSGELLQKILRLDFKSDEYTCISTLVPFKKGQSDNQQVALSNAFNNALNNVFKSSMRSWKKVVQSYILENADFLIKLMPEIEFVVKGTELIKSLRDSKNPICFPQIAQMSEKRFEATGIYNPIVATKLDDVMVKNDFTFDENGVFYVLSGPNRGGKSVITCAVGLTFALCQLGLCVPCESAVISPVDAIFTHFPSGAEDTIDKGRLGEECARLDEIFTQVTECSLVLLDESLSSTGSYEASYIASEVLSGLSMVGCRGIFSTHLHELAGMIDGINESCQKNGGAKIDTLVAGMEEGQRSFKIKRQKPDGKSYAKDIANKYGISLEHIIKKIKKI
ncbi:MAG: hypothetical protein J6B29_05115 [Clostridia bacterium]|nr:hypothetical protein [Clostridia bacterium]